LQSPMPTEQSERIACPEKSGNTIENRHL